MKKQNNEVNAIKKYNKIIELIEDLNNSGFVIEFVLSSLCLMDKDNNKLKSFDISNQRIK